VKYRYSRRATNREMFAGFQRGDLDGDDVTLTLREFGRGRSSGLEIERRIFVTYTLRDSKVVRILAALEPPGG
jgi:hypothetical protein